MAHKSCILYESQWSSMTELPDEEIGAIIRQVLNYAFYGENPSKPNMGFLFMRSQLDKDLSKYDEVCDKRRDAANCRWMQMDANVCKSIKTNNNINIINAGTNNNNNNNNSNNNNIYSDDFEKLWILYKRKGSKKSAYNYYIKLSDGEKNLLEQHIKAYVGSREVKYQKDFERYLKDKTFLTLVYAKDNNIVFDPEKISGTTKDIYSPLTGQGIVWDEQNKCYHQIGMFQGFIIDGYNDDNRPDGALVSLSNAAGNAVWNKANKKWEIKEYD